MTRHHIGAAVAIAAVVCVLQLTTATIAAATCAPGYYGYQCNSTCMWSVPVGEDAAVYTPSVVLHYAPAGVDYSTDPATNPSRGWYKYTDSGEPGYSALSDSNLATWYSKGYTVIYRLFLLSEFLDSNITYSSMLRIPPSKQASNQAHPTLPSLRTTYLESVATDFERMRAAGFKCILRFAYTKVQQATPPYNDAPLSRVLMHIEQLRPVVQANEDVVLVLQAGFIGTWGE